MKVKCHQKDLALALNLVNRAVSTNTTLPVLNNILIKAQGKKIYFSATNLEVAITYFIEADILNEGAITVPAKLITNYISLIKEDEINLKLDERGTTLDIKTAFSHTKIKGIDSSEFPVIPEIQKGEQFTIKSSLFLQAINQTSFSASMNLARPILTGILFQFEKDKVVMVATDSYRLSEKKVPILTNVSKDSNYIIPVKTIIELGKILGGFENDDVECQLSKNQIAFSVQNLRILSRLIEGVFPDYKKIIPDDGKTNVTLNTQDFIMAVKKVSLFAEETNNNIKINVTNDGKLILSTSETQIGEGVTEIEAIVKGENNQVAVNAQYLLDILAHINDENIQLIIDNKLSPITIHPAQKAKDYTHVIMPLKF
ncbi:MAG: polymerase III subunit beta, DNA polymerase III subunit beta protein [Candidatus Peregrinibacteria bacterium GW2011_GWE2_39_6]|nr:MAG: polymerase III subunit beta, DNA polymerase III subunit beta protein [Candidatus Peregrinibacteria bacterium GW2011_GWF2_39_17]KKR26592.1 MAG: polymerase III subunit beta, DNA polymerase III subunit beta protein [Candidatus Peregrinibacteria bacterium GW2011_GWE2_39_6]HCW32503.1 DNA polymerase III subunit beta [Candidatus Peregrinibacteria bacterium]